MFGNSKYKKIIDICIDNQIIDSILKNALLNIIKQLQKSKKDKNCTGSKYISANKKNGNPVKWNQEYT